MFILGGIAYQSISTPLDRGCSGCAGAGNSPLCHTLPDCGPGHLIFAEAMPTSKTWAPYEGAGRALTASQQAERERTATEGAQPTAAASEARSYKPAHGGLPSAWPGLARSTDPTTSQEAAATVSGGKLCDQILVALRAKSSLAADLFIKDLGYTGKELAALTGIGLNSVTPRFAGLRRKGLIHAAGRRDKQLVWRIGNGVAV